jgi:hypothetical protein
MNLPEPRMVTYQELYNKLFPYVQGYKWGQDTIRDLWLKGAPVPQDSCPGGKPCDKFPDCEHIRRILYPNQFEMWWNDVREKQSLDIAASEALRSVGKSH